MLAFRDLLLPLNETQRKAKMSDVKDMLLKQELLQKREAPNSAYEIVDVGIKHAHYFRGVSAKNWDAVYIGIGDNPAQALEHALSQAVEEGWNVDHIAKAQSWPDKPSAFDRLCERALEKDMDIGEYLILTPKAECALCYYMGLRLRVN